MESKLDREVQLRSLWQDLYGSVKQAKLESFIDELKTAASVAPPPPPEGWFKSVVVYSLYVDLFNHDFSGLTARLSYLQSLGVTCIWLLPVLDSPMRDAGFDVRDYRKIRPELVGGLESDKQQVFTQFVAAAHGLGIRVIFDVAINHTSEEHVWFQESRKGPDNPYRDYYIWSDTDTGYADARIIFKGMMESNWQKLVGQGYYFHRFFESQPDLNFRNPDVLLELCRVLLFWVKVGVDGFRADAVPYLWKQEGTNCENLPGTHAIVKFFRAVLDMVRPGTMVLAEACQPPHDVVAYFGEGDECHAAYHFPVMPRIYLAMAEGRAKPIFEQLALDVTPAIPDACGWFSFLRCHDELTLEMVTPDERRAIHQADGVKVLPHGLQICSRTTPARLNWPSASISPCWAHPSFITAMNLPSRTTNPTNSLRKYRPVTRMHATAAVALLTGPTLRPLWLTRNRFPPASTLQSPPC
jgi:maltose alpha-D-glucosyltransferase / alpha-amylase